MKKSNQNSIGEVLQHHTEGAEWLNHETSLSDEQRSQRAKKVRAALAKRRNVDAQLKSEEPPSGGGLSPHSDESFEEAIRRQHPSLTAEQVKYYSDRYGI